MKNENLRGMDLVALLDAGAANLRENATIVDNLNVFPIPDGDTGANMSMTIDGGLRHAEGGQDLSLGEASERIADGMLRVVPVGNRNLICWDTLMEFLRTGVESSQIGLPRQVRTRRGKVGRL